VIAKRLCSFYHRPYLVVAAFPGEMPRAIARTYNQSDVEDHVRFLKRRMSVREFYVVAPTTNTLTC
jgi:hypothetical protein